MKIGIVYTHLRPEEKMLRDAANEVGKVSLIHEAEMIYPGKYDLDAVIIRNIGHIKELYFSKIFEDMGIPTVNPWKIFLEAGDKLLSTLKLKSCVPIPPWAAAFGDDAVKKISKKLGYPVVMKPVVGSWGRMVSKINDEDALEAVLEHKKWMNSPLQKIYYIQKYIKKPKRDIRSYVINGEFVTSSYRYSEHWITNAARGGHTELCDDESVKELSIRAWECFGEGALAVDIFEDEETGNLLVNEVNPGMEFKSTARATGVNIAKKIVEYVVEVAKK